MSGKHTTCPSCGGGGWFYNAITQSHSDRCTQCGGIGLAYVQKGTLTNMLGRRVGPETATKSSDRRMRKFSRNEWIMFSVAYPVSLWLSFTYLGEIGALHFLIALILAIVAVRRWAALFLLGVLWLFVANYGK